jgi:hypothetical protein
MLERTSLFGRWPPPNTGKPQHVMASPRTQNPVQYWQLRKRLTVAEAAERTGISRERYREIVVLGTATFTDEEIRLVVAAAGIPENLIRAWEERPRGDVRNPLAR